MASEWWIEYYRQHDLFEPLVVACYAVSISTPEGERTFMDATAELGRLQIASGYGLS